MDGSPVFLASLSRREFRTGRILYVPEWTPSQVKDGAATLRRLIGPMGDPSRERLFRMNVTLCLHRALAPSELAELPPGFFEGEAEGIAGAPVEVLWENTPGSLSTRPCLAPRRLYLPGHEREPFAWVPQDCGRCPSCEARALA